MKTQSAHDIFKQYHFLQPLRIVCVELLGATIALRADCVAQVCRWDDVVTVVSGNPGLSRVVLCGGEVMPVADMRVAAQRDKPVPPATLPNFVVGKAHGNLFGMVVNEVYGSFEICALDVCERTRDSTMAPHITGAVTLGGEQIPLVDLNQLFKPWRSHTDIAGAVPAERIRN